jgi:hypothetical protein
LESLFIFKRWVIKNRILSFIISLGISLLLPPPSWASTVQVEVIHSQDRYALEGTYPIRLRLKISKPWFIHGTKSEGEGLIPTVLSFPESPRLKVEGITFPEPDRKKFDYTSKPIGVFSGHVLVKATLVVSRDAQPAERLVKGNLSYQACTYKVCLPPENVPVNLALSIVPQGAPTKALNQQIFLSAYREKNVGSGNSLGNFFVGSIP